MSYSPLTPPTSPKPRDTKNSVKLSPLSWGQYLAASLPTSSKSNETELQRMRRMQTLLRSWRDDQIARAHQHHSPRFVSHLPVTSPTSSAVTTQSTTTATEPTLTGCQRRVPTLSLCDLRALQDTPWGPSMEFRQLARRGRSRSTGTLSTPRDISAGTMSTRTKKTTKMPHKYRQYTKMPKGWAMAEVVDDEVEEVCYVTVGTFFPTWDGGPMITMLEEGSCVLSEKLQSAASISSCVLS